MSRCLTSLLRPGRRAPHRLLSRGALCILRPIEMTNDENNLGMTGDSGVNPSPFPEDGGGGSVAGAAAEGEELSAGQIEELKGKAAKADENWDKYVRVVADLDNYKKRAARERTEAVKYANEGLIEKLLPIVDNFEAALNAANSPQGGNVDSLKTGIQMIFTQMKSFLGEAGVEEIDAINKPFDPNLHEAVSQQASTEVPEGQVIQQMRKGYRYRDRLIRPAMVVVAKKP
jgi:molecular chaperone GrpE